jgi:hypothetical protein
MKANFSVLLKNSLIYGLVLGGIYMIATLLIYVLDFNIFGIFYSVAYFLILGLALPIGLCIFGANNLRLKHQPEKTITYLDAVLFCFFLIISGMLISNIFSQIFHHFIDKEYLKHMIDKFITMMNSYNVQQEKIDESVANMEKGFSVGRQLLTTLISSAILSLIIALFIRKKEKIEETY